MPYYLGVVGDEFSDEFDAAAGALFDEMTDDEARAADAQMALSRAANDARAERWVEEYRKEKP